MTIFVGILISSIIFMTILGLGSLSGMFSERSGTVNIAINGMMIMGALIYSVMQRYLASNGMQIVIFAIVGLSSGLFAMLHGVATIKFKANHIISGTALNMLAPGIAFMVFVFMDTPQHIQVNLRDLALSREITSFKSLISLNLFLAIGIFVLAWFVLNKTKWGLRFKAVGENPSAVDAAGINVKRIQFQGVFISGFLAGLSGAFFAQWAGDFRGSVQGLGFISLAIMIMGKWRTIWIVLATFVFSLLYSTANTLVATQEASLMAIKEYAYIFYAMPFAFTLLTLMVMGKRSFAPKHAGIPYENKGR